MHRAVCTLCSTVLFWREGQGSVEVLRVIGQGVDKLRNCDRRSVRLLPECYTKSSHAQSIRPLTQPGRERELPPCCNIGDNLDHDVFITRLGIAERVQLTAAHELKIAKSVWLNQFRRKHHSSNNVSVSDRKSVV